jgi:hypothetical protein
MARRAGYGDILLNRRDMQITRFGAARVARPTFREVDQIGGYSRADADQRLLQNVIRFRPGAAETPIVPTL